MVDWLVWKMERVRKSKRCQPIGWFGKWKGSEKANDANTNVYEMPNNRVVAQ